MNTVIFQTENAVFEYFQKEVKELFISKKAEYAPDEIARLLELISTSAIETILNSDDHHYFGFVALDLISEDMGTATCNICGETYNVGQLKEFAVGHGKSPFDINPEEKGGFSPLGKRKMPSLFGGQGLSCPNNHELIAMETWKT